MSAEVNYYITQKRTDTKNKIYGDEYCSRRYAKETATSKYGYEEEQEEGPSKTPKLDIGGKNGNAFGSVKNGKII